MKSQRPEKFPAEKKVVRIAAREFWVNGKCVSSCSPLFIEDEDLECRQLHFDDEYEEWKLETGLQGFPEIGTSIGDFEMEWRDVEVPNASRLIGNTIVSFKGRFQKNMSSSRLTFENGCSIETFHNLETDEDGFKIVSAS